MWIIRANFNVYEWKGREALKRACWSGVGDHVSSRNEYNTIIRGRHRILPAYKTQHEGRTALLGPYK